MQQTKIITERLHKGLDDLGLPDNEKERVTLLSKLLDISKQQAWGLIEGQLAPDENLLQQIASELEVESDWLIGKA